MVRIVAVKFRHAGKLYNFNARDFTLEPGNKVVVETDRGRALGTIVTSPEERVKSGAPDGLKNVLRHATEEDIELSEKNASREGDAHRFCLKRIKERKMEMKLVKAEYLFDGSKIIFYFTADGRVDFRELVKDLAHHFHTRIEMRQIGVRDEAKLTGGLGICGRALCCCTFLREFDPVSVKMAKEQGLALNPNKISGQCGRLLCCLNYEYETYRSLRKALPKCGRKVRLGKEEGEVVALNVLGQSATVRMEESGIVKVSAEELAQGILPASAPQKEPAKPRGKPSPRPPSGRDQRKKPKPSKEQPEEAKVKVKAQEEKPAAEAGQKPKKKRRRGRRRRPKKTEQNQ